MRSKEERKLLKIFSLHINSAMMWAWIVLISSLKPASIYWFSSPIEFHKIAVECSVEHAVCCFLFLLSFCFKDLAGVVQVHVMAFLKVAGNWNSYRMYVCAEIIDALASCGGILAIFLWSRSLARLLYSITQLCTWLGFYVSSLVRTKKKQHFFYFLHIHIKLLLLFACVLFLSAFNRSWVMPNVFHSLFILLFYIVALLFYSNRLHDLELLSFCISFPPSHLHAHSESHSCFLSSPFNYFILITCIIVVICIWLLYFMVGDALFLSINFVPFFPTLIGLSDDF